MLDVRQKKGEGLKMNPFKTKTIAVVDDEENIRKFLSFLFLHEGYEVLPFKNGDEFINYVEKSDKKIDLAILDLSMPGRSGFEAIHDMQVLDKSDVPLFVLTARALDDQLVDAIRNEPNVCDFTLKPIEPRNLTVRVREVLAA
jgi:DNA-binding response OmpR family regulator